jgi:hypothetical protein
VRHEPNSIADDELLRAQRQAVEEAVRQREAVAEVRRLLADLTAATVDLHRRNAASLAEMAGDIERLTRRLKRLGTARS